MLGTLLASFDEGLRGVAQRAQHMNKTWLTPQSQSLVLGAIGDTVRSRSDLIAENALLRQQLIVLKRQSKRPQRTSWDRWVMVWLTSRLRGWRQAIVLVQPNTVLRWHRELFKHFWSGKSQHTGGKHPLAADVVALIKQMASVNPLWGAERIRGELLKLDLHVSKSTIQKYLPKHRAPRSSQTWRTFVHNHSDQIWACDFIQLTDLLFRSLFVFVIIEIGSRRVVHVGVTRHPTDAWVAQQIREATPFGQTPRFLLRDNDRKYGHHVWAVTQGAGIHVLKTPVAAPRANAFCERFIGSVRSECLDHILILSETHLRRTMTAYVAYFNAERPHQGIGQRFPTQAPIHDLPDRTRVSARPVLGGLHHAYFWQAA